MSIKSDSKEEKPNSIECETFLKKTEEFSSIDKKIRFALDTMKESLSTEDSADFRFFWEIKHQCLGFFKQPLHASIRSQFWKEFIDLSNEAKRLRDILDEETSFAVDQIDLAIVSIEEDLNKYDELFKQINEIEFPQNCRTLNEKKAYFCEKQKELNLLNAFAGRINSLRKEIIKTNMRVSIKNKFFKRLSVIGDKIFPKRKCFIDDVSNEYKNVVDVFLDNLNFKQSPYFVLKEEIKNLQSFSKVLTLNTEVFKDSRVKLSLKWDRVKVAEKNYKVEKQQSKNHFEDVKKKIQVFKENCEKNNPLKELSEEEKEIYNYMKNLNFRNADFNKLKDLIFDAKRPILEEKEKEKLEKKQKKLQEEEKRKEDYLNLEKDILKLMENDKFSLSELQNEKIQFDEKIEKLKLSDSEKFVIERQLIELNDFIDDKKDLSLNLDDLVSLKDLFDSKKNRRQLIKREIEIYRKELGGSGFDFEKAMLYRDLIDFQKQRLDKIELSIQEIEEKISELE